MCGESRNGTWFLENFWFQPSLYTEDRVIRKPTSRGFRVQFENFPTESSNHLISWLSTCSSWSRGLDPKRGILLSPCLLILSDSFGVRKSLRRSSISFRSFTILMVHCLFHSSYVYLCISHVYLLPRIFGIDIRRLRFTISFGSNYLGITRLFTLV